MTGNTNHPALKTNSLPPSHCPTLERYSLSCSQKHENYFLFYFCFQTRLQTQVGRGGAFGRLFQAFDFTAKVHERIPRLTPHCFLAMIINNYINWLFSKLSDELLVKIESSERPQDFIISKLKGKPLDADSSCLHK